MSLAVIRSLLALLLAFVFTGQVASATAHCAHQAELAHAAFGDVTAESSAGCHHQDDKPAPVKPPTAPFHCDCIQVLKTATLAGPVWAVGEGPAAAWERPSGTRFSSLQPQPDGRPPKA